jgi:hypothetical protein
LDCTALSVGKQGWCADSADASLKARFMAADFTLEAK